jgi:Protein of unknown function (DUF2796)
MEGGIEGGILHRGGPALPARTCEKCYIVSILAWRAESSLPLPDRFRSFEPVLMSSSRLAVSLLTIAVVAACERATPAAPSEAPPAAEQTAAVESDASVEAHGHSHDEDGGHSHDDEDVGASGTAHAHGIADFALSREGDRYLGELISPLANFGLSETDAAFTDTVTAELSGLVELDGGACTAAVPHPMVDAGTGHSDGIVHFVWTCAQPDSVSALRFSGFEAFGGFEKVSVIYLAGATQKAGEVTPSVPEFSLK